MSSHLSLPAYWEERYQNGETRWDKGEASPPLRDFLHNSPLHGNILVPGCGAGHDVRLLAAHGANPVGIDFSESAIRLAKSFPRVSTESYEVADFLHLPTAFHRAFDTVVEHTLFCAIDPARRDHYIDSVIASLKPGGKFLAIFYSEPADAAEDGPPFGVTRDEIHRRLDPAFHRQEFYEPEVAYDGRLGRELLWLGQLKDSV